jgi:hypothetical protein
VALVVEADRVDRVDLVGVVEVGVEAVHHHRQLVGLLATVLGIDDEEAVEALGDVRGERARVAVVVVDPERGRVELVGEPLPRPDETAAAVLADARHPVHEGGVDAVEVDRVRMRGPVPEVDSEELALAAAQGRAGDPPVVGPGGIVDPGRDLDLLVERIDSPLAQHPPARQPPGRAPVEVAEHLAGIEAVGPVVDIAVHGEAGVRHLGAARRGAAGIPVGRGGGSVEGVVQTPVRDQLVQDRQAGAGGRGSAQEPPSADAPRTHLRPLRFEWLNS